MADANVGFMSGFKSNGFWILIYYREWKTGGKEIFQAFCARSDCNGGTRLNANAVELNAIAVGLNAIVVARGQGKDSTREPQRECN